MRCKTLNAPRLLLSPACQPNDTQIYNPSRYLSARDTNLQSEPVNVEEIANEARLSILQHAQTVCFSRMYTISVGIVVNFAILESKATLNIEHDILSRDNKSILGIAGSNIM